MTRRPGRWAAGTGVALALVVAAATVPGALRGAAQPTRTAPLTGERPDDAGPAAAAPPGRTPAAGGDAPRAAKTQLPVAPGPPPQARDGSGASPLAPPRPPPPPAPARPAPRSAAPGVPAPTEPAPDVRVVRPFAAVPVAGTAGGITVGTSGRVHTATDAPGDVPMPAQLLTFDSAGALERTDPVPGQSLSRTRGVSGLATARDGTLLVTDAERPRVLRHDPARGRWIVRSPVPDVPPCRLPVTTRCQPGLLDTLPLLTGIAVAADGTAYVADAGQGIVFALREGEPARPWWSADDVRGAQGLAGLDVDADGHVLVAVGRLGDPLGRDLGGVVLRILREPDGTAGARSRVAAFPAGQRPADVAVAPTGTTYVAVRGDPALVVLDPRGREVRRISDDALGDPTALHLLPDRLLVSVGGPRKAIASVDVGDG